MSQKDIPVKQNSAATGVFLEGTLEEQRTALLNDLGNIPEVTADFMLDHIVPNIGINVDHTMRKLKGNEVLLGGAGWKEFVGALPKKSSDTEQKVFFRKWELFTRESLILPCLTMDLHVLLQWL